MAAPFPSPTKGWHTQPYDAIDAKRPELLMDGKAAVITGAGGAIGKATALAFAAAGISHLALIGRRTTLLDAAKKEIQRQYPSPQIEVYSGDITDTESMSGVMQRFRQSIKRPIDILVSNAGYFSTSSIIAKAEEDDWWQSFNTNVRGAYVIFRAFFPVASSTATIVNVSTALAHSPPVPFAPGVSAYASSKLAAAKVFEYLQFEQPDLKVVNLQPGMVDSEISQKNGAAPALDDASLPGHFIIWLCSQESDFLKGRYLWANWDVPELVAMREQIEKTSLLTLTLDGWPFAKGVPNFP